MDNAPVHKPGSLAARLFAEILDQVFLSALVFLANDFLKKQFLLDIGLFVFAALYRPVLIGTTGMTVGKWICRVKVVGPDGETKPRIGQAFFREWIGKFVSSAVFSLGYLTALLDRKNRTWHDKIADTYVIALDRTRKPVAAETSEVPVTAGRKVLFWTVTATWVVLSLILPVIVLGYLFVARPNQVSGRSMDPNYRNNQYILTDITAYKRGDPKRGDAVTFMSPRNSAVLNIGRIIGMPGDTIRISSGYVYVNGRQLDESAYLPKGTMTYGGTYLPEGREVTVSGRQYIVMGDNRPRSNDSREYGPVAREMLQGKVLWCYWNCTK